MRISDWSSDVCSSDLIAGVSIGLMVAGAIAHSYGWRSALMVAGLASLPLVVLLLMLPEPTHASAEVGQATTESLWASLAILLRRRAFFNLNPGLGISFFGIYGIDRKCVRKGRRG